MLRCTIVIGKTQIAPPFQAQCCPSSSKLYTAGRGRKQRTKSLTAWAHWLAHVCRVVRRLTTFWIAGMIRVTPAETSSFVCRRAKSRNTNLPPTAASKLIATTSEDTTPSTPLYSNLSERSGSKIFAVRVESPP
ncbi:unnamed protein product [Scytosiphon promiscuus]